WMDIQAVLFARQNYLINASVIPRRSFSLHSRHVLTSGLKSGIAKCSMKSYKLSELTPTEVNGLKARPRIDFSSIFSTVNPIVDDVRTRGDAAVIEFTARFDKVTLDKIVENVADLPDPELANILTVPGFFGAGFGSMPSYPYVLVMLDFKPGGLGLKQKRVFVEVVALVLCGGDYLGGNNMSCFIVLHLVAWTNINLDFDVITYYFSLLWLKLQLDPAVREAFDVAYDNIYAFHFAQKAAEKTVENMTGVRCKRVARCITSVGIYVPGGTAVLPSTALMLSVPAQIAGCKTVVLATPPSQDGSICKEVLYCAKKAGVTHILKAGGAQAISALAWGTRSCPKVEKIFGPGNQYVTAAKMILQNSEAMVSIDMPAGPSEVLVIADKYANPVHIAADLLSQAISFSNIYAPEHLIINVKDAEKWEGSIENAGSVFLGPWTPESVGDYASGTNHVLPTYGYARMYSGVSLDSFLKFITIQSLTKEGLQKLGPYVEKMAEVEGLDAHKRAVSLRLQDIETKAPV
ncbi:hypothetical protein IFM89_037370, partial [Coptis chinensis]